MEVAIQGPSLADDRTHAAKVRAELAKLPFLRDLQLAQPQDYPTLQVNIDRDRAGQYGLTMARCSPISGAATLRPAFTDPNYWRDPNSGNAFQIQVEIPQNRIQSTTDLAQLPVAPNGASRPLLGEVADLKEGTAPGLMERYNGQRVLSLTANLHGITLGKAIPEIQQAIDRAGTPPRGVRVLLRGQVPALQQTITGLQTGLLLAVLVIFLLLAANFQSLRLALAIVLTVPAVLCGVVLMLLATGHHPQHPILYGRHHGDRYRRCELDSAGEFLGSRATRAKAPVLDAAREGALGRLRAVLMTASAMIIGMVPMAMGLGESGEQSAPLAVPSSVG